jgi:hypothetical protein
LDYKKGNKMLHDTKRLIEEFENMKNIPMFEIQIEEEFYVYHIQATENGLEAGGCSNTGFMPYGINIEWDVDFGLDQHLEGLYESCYDDAYLAFNQDSGE